MKKKIISLILAAAMCICPAAAYAGEAHADDGTLYLDTAEENLSGDGWSWDSSKDQLILENFSRTVERGSGIVLPENATVILKGNSFLNVTQKDEATLGIDCRGNLTFKGSGKLTVCGYDECMAAVYSAGCLNVIDGAEITAKLLRDGNPAGDVFVESGIIHVVNDVVVKGGSINAETDNGNPGIVSLDGTVSVAGGADVKVDVTSDISDASAYSFPGIIGIYGKDIDISGGAVNIRAVSGLCNAYGILSENRISISGGSVEIHTDSALEDPYSCVAVYAVSEGENIPEKDLIISRHEADSGFSDVNPDDWFADDVLFCSSNGIMNGTGKALFSPYGRVSRAMVAAMIYRMEGSPDCSMEDAGFDDVSGGWYSDAVSWCAANGIVKGTDESHFSPDKYVSREELAAMLFRYAVFKSAADKSAYGKNIASDAASFADISNVSEWALPAVSWALDRGLIKGIDGNIMPGDGALRCQVAAVFHRLSGIL